MNARILVAFFSASGVTARAAKEIAAAVAGIFMRFARSSPTPPPTSTGQTKRAVPPWR